MFCVPKQKKKKATLLLTFVINASYRKKRSHQLRYVLRNRTTKQVYLVILFTLYPKEDVNEDGSLKPEASQAYAQIPAATAALDGQQDEAQPSLSNVKESDGEAVLEEARKHLSDVNLSSKDKGKAVASQDDEEVD